MITGGPPKKLSKGEPFGTVNIGEFVIFDEKAETTRMLGFVSKRSLINYYFCTSPWLKVIMSLPPV